MRQTLITIIAFAIGFPMYSQNIGIGITTPVSKLHVNGTSWLQGDNTPLPASAGKGIAIGYGAVGFGYIFGYDYLNNQPKDLILQHPGGNVGIGTSLPDFKLTVSSSVIQSNNNTNLLSLKGRNPVLAFTDENNLGFGYIKSWTNAPYSPFTNGLVIGSNPGYPIFFSTNNYGVSMYVADNGQVSVNGPPSFYHTPALTCNGRFTIVEGDTEWKLWALTSINDHGLIFSMNGSGMAMLTYPGGTWISYSDERLKDNIETYNTVIDKVKKLNVVSYHFKSYPSKKCFGLIAQNVQQYFPELVTQINAGENDNYLGISYPLIGVIAIKAIQEQQVIIEDLKKQLIFLQKQVDGLKNYGSVK